MNTPNCKTRLPLLALLLCGAFAAVPAWAAPTTDPAELATLAARHRQERANCMNVQESETRADCVRDTNVAYAHAKRNRPSDIDPPFAKNVTLRCDALAGDERRDCLARMHGQGTTSGSVVDGGIYRELVVVETIAAPAPTTPSAPAAATAPSVPATSTTVLPPAPATTPMAPMVPMTMVPMTPVAPAASTATPPSATNPTTPK